MFMRTYANGDKGQGDIAYFCGNTDNISLEVPFASNVSCPCCFRACLV